MVIVGKAAAKFAGTNKGFRGSAGASEGSSDVVPVGQRGAAALRNSNKGLRLTGDAYLKRDVDKSDESTSYNSEDNSSNNTINDLIQSQYAISQYDSDVTEIKDQSGNTVGVEDARAKQSYRINQKELDTARGIRESQRQSQRSKSRVENALYDEIAKQTAVSSNDPTLKEVNDSLGNLVGVQDSQRQQSYKVDRLSADIIKGQRNQERISILDAKRKNEDHTNTSLAEGAIKTIRDVKNKIQTVALATKDNISDKQKRQELVNKINKKIKNLGKVAEEVLTTKDGITQFGKGLVEFPVSVVKGTGKVIANLPKLMLISGAYGYKNDPRFTSQLADIDQQIQEIKDIGADKDVQAAVTVAALSVGSTSNLLLPLVKVGVGAAITADVAQTVIDPTPLKIGRSTFFLATLAPGAISGVKNILVPIGRKKISLPEITTKGIVEGTETFPTSKNPTDALKRFESSKNDAGEYQVVSATDTNLGNKFKAKSTDPEIKGLYVTPEGEASLYFTRLMENAEYLQPELTLLPKINNPNIIKVQNVKSIERIPKSVLLKDKNVKRANPLKESQRIIDDSLGKGKAYLGPRFELGRTVEIEAVIPVETVFRRTNSKLYFEYNGKNVPINEYKIDIVETGKSAKQKNVNIDDIGEIKNLKSGLSSSRLNNTSSLIEKSTPSPTSKSKSKSSNSSKSKSESIKQLSSSVLYDESSISSISRSNISYRESSKTNSKTNSRSSNKNSYSSSESSSRSRSSISRSKPSYKNQSKSSSKPSQSKNNNSYTKIYKLKQSLLLNNIENNKKIMNANVKGISEQLTQFTPTIIRPSIPLSRKRKLGYFTGVELR